MAIHRVIYDSLVLRSEAKYLYGYILLKMLMETLKLHAKY